MKSLMYLLHTFLHIPLCPSQYISPPSSMFNLLYSLPTSMYNLLYKFLHIHLCPIFCINFSIIISLCPISCSHFSTYLCSTSCIHFSTDLYAQSPYISPHTPMSNLLYTFLHIPLCPISCTHFSTYPYVQSPVHISPHTSMFNLLYTFLHDCGDERILSLHQRGQIDPEHPLDVLHVGHAVVGHLLRTFLVGVETTVWERKVGIASQVSLVHITIYSHK